MASSSGEGRASCKKTAPIYIHKTPTDLVHHGQPAMKTPLFQRWPLQLMQHRGNAASVIVVLHHIPSRTALDTLDPFAISSSMRVPSDRGVLHYRANKSGIYSLLNLATAAAKISRKEASRTTSLPSNSINMFIKVELAVQDYT